MPRSLTYWQKQQKQRKKEMGCTLSAPLVPISSVDMKRYAGVWYQIAALPTWFQHSGEYNTKATYTYKTLDTGQPVLKVENTYIVTGMNGLPAQGSITGVARPDSQCAPTIASKNGDVAGCFLVSFTPSASEPIVSPVPGHYWIIELADDYRYAVVSEPMRKTLWILSRTPTLADGDKTYILDRLRSAHCFSSEALTQLVWTPQDWDTVGRAKEMALSVSL